MISKPVVLVSEGKFTRMTKKKFFKRRMIICMCTYVSVSVSVCMCVFELDTTVLADGFDVGCEREGSRHHVFWPEQLSDGWSCCILSYMRLHKEQIY